MCTGAEIGLLLAAGGTAAGTINQQQALRRQDRRAAAGIRSQQELQREAAGRTQQAIQEFGASRPEPHRDRLLDEYMGAIRGAQPTTEAAMRAPGAVNPRFAEEVGQRQAGLAARGGALGQSAAGIDAAAIQRMGEGQQIARAGFDIGDVGRRSAAEDFLTRMRVAGAQPNPWVGAAGNIMQGVGTAMAMAPGRTPVPSTDVLPASAWDELARVGPARAGPYLPGR